MATRARKPGLDFNTLNAARNGGVRGIWSDGEVMWASDFNNDKVYSYNLPPSDNAGLKALALSGLTLDPAFASGTVSYAATATAASTTVTAPPRQRFTRSVTITPADGDAANGHQVDLPDDALTVIRVRVTAQDGGSKTYTVRVTRGTPPVPADDATLIHLSLSNPADGGAITLTPPFGSGETGYTAQVDDGVSEADVSATASHPSATVAVTGGAGNVLAGPVPLDEGKNVINVTVTSADGSASKTYTVTVWRAEAPPQIIKGPYIRRAPANGQTFAGPYVIQGPDGQSGVIREEIEVLVTFSEKFLVWPDSDRSASEIGTAPRPLPLRGAGHRRGEAPGPLLGQAAHRPPMGGTNPEKHRDIHLRGAAGGPGPERRDHCGGGGLPARPGGNRPARCGKAGDHGRGALGRPLRPAPRGDDGVLAGQPGGAPGHGGGVHQRRRPRTIPSACTTGHTWRSPLTKS